MRRILQAVGCGAAVLALAGCWPTPGADANRSNHNPFEQALNAETVADLTPQWSWTSPDSSISEPVLSPHGLHVVTGCYLHTLSPASGQVRWAGALPMDNPDPNWCFSVSQTPRAEPYVSADGNTVQGSLGFFVESPAGHLAGQGYTRSFAAASGTPGPVGNGLLVAQRGSTRVDSVLVDAGDHLLANDVTVGGRTFVLDAFGWTTWPGWPNNLRPPSAKLTLGDEALFHTGPGVLASEPGPASFGHGVRAYALADARPGCGPVTAPGGTVPVECPLWATPTDGVPSRPVLSPDGSRLYTRTDAGTLYAIDAATGDVLWTATGLGDPTSLALADGIVYVGTGLDLERNGRVLLFDDAGCGAATCDPLSPEGFDLGSVGAVSAVTVAGDVVYAVLEHTVHAGVGCLPDGVCDEVWSGPGTGTPVVSNGQLFVTGGTGGPALLTAYGLD